MKEEKGVNYKKCIDSFNNLFENDGYVSKKKFDEFFEQYKSVFQTISPLDSCYEKIMNISKNGQQRLDNHNNTYLDKMYLKYKEYFEKMYVGIDDGIKLDEKQIRAILADEDYALIIAGAGTGKTTTMTSKVKYLVDIKKVDPSRILVMSYTKKATMELEDRIVNNFKIQAHVTTFHSLGYDYIKERLTGKKCVIVDENIKNEIFLAFFKKIFEDKARVKELIDSFSVIKKKKWMFARFFKEHYLKYNTFDEFFEHYKKYQHEKIRKDGIQKWVEARIESALNGEAIRTIKDEIVRSIAEGRIANYLFIHGIDYEYEKTYTELMDNNSPYKPDFTIDFASTKVYIEYFGLDNERYNRIRKQKEEYHAKHHNTFIVLGSSDYDNLEEKLEDKLIELGFNIKLKTYEEICEQFLDNNPLAQLYNFKDFIYECIECIKASNQRETYQKVAHEYLANLEGIEQEESYVQFKYIDEFYKFYENYLHGADVYRFDYSDLLYYSKRYIFEIPSSNLKFDYIIIDEYQDISKDRYELAKNTADKNNARVFAVGDDWQSIYAFSGARIKYIYNFNRYFKGAKQFEITKTYRNSQELIDVTGKFIMKNNFQISKELTSDKHITNPIIFVNYDSSIENEYDVLKNLILKIHKVEPEHKILILARTNKMIDDCTENPAFKDDIGTKITFVGYNDIILEGMTMHKSKGLTFDEVIIIGLNKKFPSSKYNSHWFIDLFKNSILAEPIPYAEERRLFYVALTRTKNRVFLLADKNSRLRSTFIDELSRIINNMGDC